MQRVAIKNLSAVLEAAGSSLNNIVKVNVFLTTMDDFAPMNQAYDEFFGSVDPKPVSQSTGKYTCLVSLPPMVTYGDGLGENASDETIQCRTCVAVHQLPFGAKMEIECTAFVEPASKL